MPPVRQHLSLQQFLLTFALADVSTGTLPGRADRVIPNQHRGTDSTARDPGSRTTQPWTNHSALRTEILRHTALTMKVVSLDGTVTVTRCQACPNEETQPCRALKLLALPYAQHPAYRPEWHTDPPSAPTTADAKVFDMGAVHGPPPSPRLSEIPAPGLARRRILRSAGINLTVADFSAEERAQRGFRTALYKPDSD